MHALIQIEHNSERDRSTRGGDDDHEDSEDLAVGVFIEITREGDEVDVRGNWFVGLNDLPRVPESQSPTG